MHRGKFSFTEGVSERQAVGNEAGDAGRKRGLLCVAQKGMIYHQGKREPLKDFNRQRHDQNCILNASLA